MGSDPAVSTAHQPRPSLETLATWGSDPIGFAELAERLYAPLLHAVRKPKEKKGNSGKGKGGKA